MPITPSDDVARRNARPPEDIDPREVKANKKKREAFRPRAFT
jgi:hypothetical protein